MTTSDLDHPPSSALDDFAAGRDSAEAAEEIILHTRGCERCRTIVGDLQDQRDASRRLRRRLAE